MDGLQILDVNVQTDATRQQNAYLCDTIPRLIDLLENAGSGGIRWFCQAERIASVLLTAFNCPMLAIRRLRYRVEPH